MSGTVSSAPEYVKNRKLLQWVSEIAALKKRTAPAAKPKGTAPRTPGG